MSKNVNQVYSTNPSKIIGSNDLFYFGQSPYGINNDTAIKFSDLLQNITQVGTITSGVWNGGLVQSTSNPIISGASSGGYSGIITAYPVGGNLGSLSLQASNNADNNNITITNASFSQSTTLTIEDPGSSSGYLHCSQSTFPQTTTINRILFSSANNTISEIATANNGTLITSNTGVPSMLAGPGTSGNILQSNSSSAPSWSTPTYPSASGGSGKILRSNGTNNIYSTATFADTYSSNNLLYSNGANTITGLATANSAMLVTSSLGAPSLTTSMTDAQVVFGNSNGTPTPGSFVAGSGISLSYSGGNLTIAANSNIFRFDVTCTAAQLASGGSVILFQAASGSAQYQILNLWININASFNFTGGGGDRSGTITDGSTVNYATIPSATMQSQPNVAWGNTALTFPLSAPINRLTNAGANLIFQYYVGSTDYSTGRILLSGLVQRVA